MDEIRLARASAVMTFIGIGIMLTAGWFFLVGIGDPEFFALTEDDLKEEDGTNLTAEINAYFGSSITVVVSSSTDDEIRVDVSIYDPNGNIMERSKGETPLTVTTYTMGFGDYGIVINITGDFGIDDIDVTISSPTVLSLISTIIALFLGPVSVAFMITGMIMTIVALNRRASKLRREKEIRMERSYPMYGTSNVPYDVRGPNYMTGPVPGYNQQQAFRGNIQPQYPPGPGYQIHNPPQYPAYPPYHDRFGPNVDRGMQPHTLFMTDPGPNHRGYPPRGEINDPGYRGYPASPYQAGPDHGYQGHPPHPYQGYPQSIPRRQQPGIRMEDGGFRR
ncbi:MAG: hypothetical protein ACMUIG_07945 [Thermoplasmatota archaeon]